MPSRFKSPRRFVPARSSRVAQTELDRSQRQSPQSSSCFVNGRGPRQWIRKTLCQVIGPASPPGLQTSPGQGVRTTCRSNCSRFPSGSSLHLCCSFVQSSSLTWTWRIATGSRKTRANSAGAPLQHHWPWRFAAKGESSAEFP